MLRTGRHWGWSSVSHHRSQRAASALAHLPEADPGLASLAIWCDLADSDSATSFVSGDRIHIGADFAQLPLHEQIGLLGHHILHIALRHELRLLAMKQRSSAAYAAQIHTLCADAVINTCLIRAGHALPRPAVSLEDVVCKVLPNDLQSDQDPLSQWDMDRLYSYLMACDDQVKTRLDAYIAATEFQPDIRPCAPDPDAQAKDAEWRMRVIRAQQAGGSAGRGIGGVLRQIADLHRSRTPWEHHLRRLLARATSPDPRRSFRRPRSSWIAREAHAIATAQPRPVFEPSTPRQSKRLRIVVGIDTSGSIGRDILGVFAGEVAGIARRTGAETHVLCFDETVYAHHRLEPANIGSFFASLAFRQDGGTSFIDVIAQAEALSPAALVLLTDMNGAFGPPPSTRVIWASHASQTTPPPFGDCVEILR